MSMALGLIEAIGLTAAVTVADSAAKAADIEIIGMENTRGSGRIVVKLQGDVGAVKAAVEAAARSGNEVGAVCACQIIPRPAESIRGVFCKDESVSYEQKDKMDDEKDEDEKITCNLCMDPLCTRKRGEPHVNCIHYNDEKINSNESLKGESHE